MSACIHPPLAVPKHYDPMFKVDTLLHEPTMARLYSRTEIGFEMMSFCTQMDALCKKELLQQPTHEIRNGKTSTSFMDKASLIEDRMRQTLVKDRSLPFSLPEYLETTGLGCLFPRPQAFLSDTAGFSLNLEQSRTDEYLSCLNKLNQLTTLSHQINEDITNSSRPKYLAHQLALLYQCISTLPNISVLSGCKKSIEDNFKDVRQLMGDAEQVDQPLPEDIRAWVWDLTSQVCELVESLPAQLTQSVLLPASVVARI